MHEYKLTSCTVLVFLSVLVMMACDGNAPSEQSSAAAVERISAPWHGDLPEILESRRFIRALVTYNQTNFFIENGTPRGLEYDLLKRYEEFLNRNRKKNELKIKMVFSVLPFDQLLSALADGRGDIVAAGLTITPDRTERVAFSAPYLSDVDEVLVTGPNGGDLVTINDLSLRTIHVMAGSSYATHLKELNLDLQMRFQRPIRIIEADAHLEEEDLLQMVNAGIYDMTVVDSHLAQIWSRVLPDIQVHEELKVSSGGEIAWAVRKENPELLANLNQFFRTHRQGTFAGNMLVRRYYENTRWIQNPLSSKYRNQFDTLKELFQKYARTYGFDWLKIAALAYQESRLDHAARSHRGAVGIMQLLPSTAAGPAIGIPDITDVENNIHAGVKYLAYLRDTYFDDPAIAPEYRIDFAIAAYNAGPTRINQMRIRAEKLGLDPNQWFSNVEQAALRFIGREPVQYVSNIYIYYVAYQTAAQVVDQRSDSAFPPS